MARFDFPADSLAGVHVLVVEDDDDCRDLLRTILSQCGALVTAVPSAREALRTLDRVIPDALVSDITMPAEDGYWLIREVRARPAHRGGGLPAVAITAHGDSHGPRRTLAAGFQAHLGKPIEPWELCRTMAGVVRRA